MRHVMALKSLLYIAAICVVAASGSAQAQSYPSRPITVVVPFPAGGPSDVVARIVTEQMGTILGQSMIVENVAGAGGTIGSARVAAAPPDGYTLLAGSMGSHVAAPVLTPNVKYDSERDFEPIGFTAHAPAVIVARKDFPAKDLREFVDYLRTNGDRVKQAHGGIGASSHMACLLFTTQAGVKPASVAYRGTGPAMNDLIGGHVDFFCEQAVSVAPQILGGAIKAYGVSSPERLAILPAVPTAKEAGIDYEMSIWAGIFAPKGTPKDVINKLADALNRALADPGVAKRLADLGGSLPRQDERTPEKFAAFVKAEIARWSPILKSANAETKWMIAQVERSTSSACWEATCRNFTQLERFAVTAGRQQLLPSACLHPINGRGRWHSFCDIVAGHGEFRAATRSRRSVHAALNPETLR
jgi:putative tricarboxylic transport membrane protein